METTVKHFDIFDDGSVVLITPISEEAREWVAENMALEPWQWLGGGFACEPRMVGDLLEGFENR